MTILDRGTVERTVLGVLTTSGSDPHPNDKEYSSSYYTGLRLRSLVIAHLDTLMTPECAKLWLWARDVLRTTFRDYQGQQPQLRKRERTGRFYDHVPDFNYFMNESCAMLSLALGIGIDVLSKEPAQPLPGGLPQPPASLRSLFSTR
jgi:hypothetical protein